VTDDWVARGGPPPEAPAPVESVAEAVLFIATRPRSWRVANMVVDPA
jgi:NADP-dependent 3-hydroxy acid dehydrogenase YdfG